MNKRQRKKQLKKVRPIDLSKVSTEELWEALAPRLVSVSSGGHTFFADVNENWPHMTIYNMHGFSLVTKRTFREA
jgi:hypothetical protein